MTALVLGDLTGMTEAKDQEAENENDVVKGALGKKGRRVRVGDQKGLLIDVGCPKEA